MEIALFDTTLIAQLLDRFGVDYIDGGWPASNPKDSEFFPRARQLSLQHAKVAAFRSTRKAGCRPEADLNLRTLLDAETPTVAIFGKSWTLRVDEVLRPTREENLAMIRDSVAFFKEHGKEVVYDAEHFFDGYRPTRPMRSRP